MVLGVDWLSQFNLVIFDFKQGSIMFAYKGAQVELNSENADEEFLMMEWENQWLRRQPYGIVAKIQAMNEEERDTLPTEVQVIIEQYSEVFVEPRGMPPPRFNDHRIPLKEGAQPFKIKPYRCPYMQKTEIERMVMEMLETGIIQQSNSPYASPVLLVIKKDGT